MTDRSNYRRADDAYEARNDNAAAVSGDFNDSTYTSADQYPVQVQEDSAPVNDPMQPPQSNSDAQLARDEKEAINKSNMMKDRTRHATVKGNVYSEGPEEDDLPQSVRSGNDGRSGIRQ